MIFSNPVLNTLFCYNTI